MPFSSRPVTGLCLAAAVTLGAAACGGNNPAAPTPTPAACSYSVSTISGQVPSAGQAITVHVDTTASCSWTARSSSNWTTLSAASGTGPADVVITVAPNDQATERTATVTIADKDLAVRQSGRVAAACSYTLESGNSTFGAAGGKGTLAVQTAAGCTWTARVADSWIQLRVSGGTGPGQIEYDVAPFDGTAQRETRISVGEASFAIRQDPAPPQCRYTVDPTSAQLHWHGTAGDGMDIQITASDARCTWTAQPGASWVELLTPTSGTGSASGRVRVAAYTNATTRSAPLMIRWPTETAGQNVWLTQEGCRYAISVQNDLTPAAGGRHRVSVFGDPVTVSCAIGCPWTVSTTVPWIHPVGSTTRAGDDDVSYDIDPNTTGGTRTGTLVIGGLRLTVVQGG